MLLIDCRPQELFLGKEYKGNIKDCIYGKAFYNLFMLFFRAILSCGFNSSMGIPILRSLREYFL